MKNIILLSILTAIFSVLSFTPPAFAHGDEPRLEISAEQLNPGAQLELRGVDFEIETEVTLSLVGSQVEIPLGVVTADLEGGFLFLVTLPADLVDGTYSFRAATEDHQVDSPPITVSGPPIVSDGSAERLDEETGYGLLAPMPTPAKGVSTIVPPLPAPAETAQEKQSSLPFMWIASGIGVLAVIVALRKLRK